MGEVNNLKIFVGNLPFKIDKEILESLFSRFGEIQGINIRKDRDTGKMKGFAFVTYKSPSSATEAIRLMNGYTFHDRPLTVNIAESRGGASKQQTPQNSNSNIEFVRTVPSSKGKSNSSAPSWSSWAKPTLKKTEDPSHQKSNVEKIKPKLVKDPSTTNVFQNKESSKLPTQDDYQETFEIVEIIPPTSPFSTQATHELYQEMGRLRYSVWSTHGDIDTSMFPEGVWLDAVDERVGGVFHFGILCHRSSINSPPPPPLHTSGFTPSSSSSSSFPCLDPSFVLPPPFLAPTSTPLSSSSSSIPSLPSHLLPSPNSSQSFLVASARMVLLPPPSNTPSTTTDTPSDPSLSTAPLSPSSSEDSRDLDLWLKSDPPLPLPLPTVDFGRLVVLPQYERRGFAQKLNEIRLEKSRSLSRLSPTTPLALSCIATASEGNRRLLSRLGFTEVGKQVSFSDRPGVIFHAMQLNL